ncbi:integral membrane protein [Rhodotorula toruloides]|uniref:Integral membrane protein n=1 Tax=Rhodotorula toruloides TaxID=5286 RepID=A0A511KH89_RHOTO|nr:integral membrane protein [Rhodotorula toruloides]
MRALGGRDGRVVVTLVLISLILGVAAHEHHEVETGPYEQNFTNDENLDSVIKWHIAIQIFCWGLLFPAGMVLGITRSRFHVPLQSLGIVLTLSGNFLGHHHAGRSFHMTAHAYFAKYLWWYLILQTVMGVFLKLHVMESTTLRRGVVTAHGVVGKSFPIAGWVQMLFGLAHFIMGSSFIAYAMILLLMLRVGAGFLARNKLSQEYLDSWVIMLWGIINTFTEHDFLSAHPTGWSHEDMQHTSLGVLWWAGGALGIWLGRKQRRNIVPALIIGMTGYAMAHHGQHLQFSEDVHKFFGYALVFAAFARIIEVCFVLRDAPTPAPSETEGPRSFLHLTPFLLVLSGLTFLSATEEQMQWVAESGMDSTTYSIILVSGAFAIYLVGILIVDLYEHQMRLKSTAQAVGIPHADADVEGGGRGIALDASPNLRSFSPSTRDLRVFGVPVPGVVAGVVGKVMQVVQSLKERDGNSRGAAGGGAAAMGHARRATVEYESLPLTAGRDSVDARQEDGVEMQQRNGAGAG